MSPAVQPTLRHVRQPGPVAPVRVAEAAGIAQCWQPRLEPGQTLLDAVAKPMLAAGMEGGQVELRGGTLAPFRYVRPAASTDPAHVAWYSAPFAPPGETRLERASITFGRRDGLPFLHCHAVWTEPDGARRGGHILCEDTVLTGSPEAQAWGSPGIAVTASPDLETGFTLFAPRQRAAAPAQTKAKRLLLARIRPNEEVHNALEALCRRHGVTRATVRGLGSLIGIAFADGNSVPGPPTELLLTEGSVEPGENGPRARLSVAVADEAGEVHEGLLLRGASPVLITMELALLEHEYSAMSMSDPGQSQG